MSLRRERWEAWKERNADWYEILAILIGIPIGILVYVCVGLCVLAFWLPLIVAKRLGRKKQLRP